MRKNKTIPVMLGVFSVLLGTVFGIVLVQYTVRGTLFGFNFSINDVITDNIFSNTWRQASSDAQLQSLTTLIVAIPGLSIIKMFFENKRKN